MNYRPQSYAGDASSPGADLTRSGHSIMRSSDVIREAKQWTDRVAVKTKRPHTPRDSRRELFGQRRSSSSSRPPSAISINSGIFDPADPDSRPGSAAPYAVKLAPLPKAPIVPENAVPAVSPKVHAPMPPSFNKRSARPQPRNLFPKRIPSGGSSPMKAFQLDSHNSDSIDEGVLPTASSASADRNTNDAGSEIMNFSSDSDSKTTGININLAQLYGNSDKAEFSQEIKHSASSSSSSGSSLMDPERPRSKKRSGGSAGGTGEETADQAKYWNQNVLPLMERLEDNTQSREEVYKICKQLHFVLKEGDCLKNLLGRRRTSLLSTLFKQLNSTTTRVHLSCAKIILDLRVRRQNLNSVCKMLYKISREKRLDEVFVENDLIKSMLDVITNFSDPLDNYETLVYLTGTIKFLSDNKVVSEELVAKECTKCFIGLLSDIMTSLQERNYQKKEKLHATDILIQITAVLRSISDIDRQSFIGSNMFTYLMDALHVLATDESLTLNISRIISKLTMYDDIYPELLESQSWSPAIWNAITIHKKCLNIVIRLFFVLGNVTAKEEKARLTIHNTKLRPTSANSLQFDPMYLSVTNSVLEIYIETLSKRDDPQKKAESDDHHEKCLDTVNKIVRVIANLAISEVSGEAIACNQRCIDNIMAVLREIPSSESEELIINTLTALNNLSYYSTEKNVITKNRIEIAKVLINILITGSMPCIMEAVRVFGNISRYDDIPPLLRSNKIDLMMVTLLDSKTCQMVYSACGVLINISTKQSNRLGLLKEGIIAKLVDVLKHFAPAEWHVGGVACQLLWNLCDDGAIDSDEADSILQVLHAYLEENAPLQLLDSSKWESDFTQFVLETWKREFCPVAVRLYRKISSQHSQLLPL